MKKEIKIEISARHLHISESDYKILFDKDDLTKKVDVSQPGQFASEETVILRGPKGEIDDVRILGPFRDQTQIELSKTDLYTLGIKAPLRLSGDLKDSGGVLVVGPAGEIELQSGVIMAKRHLHVSTNRAREWNLKPGQIVSVSVGDGDGGDIMDLIFSDVVVRVSDNYVLVCHVDTDEANAANIDNLTIGTIIE